MAQNVPVFGSPTTYVSIPVEIVAVQWDGSALHADTIIEWIRAAGGRANYRCEDVHTPENSRIEGHHIVIRTPEGDMKASGGWWIIKGTEDEFYPCKDSVFQRKYQRSTTGTNLTPQAPQIHVGDSRPLASPAAVATMIMRQSSLING